MSAQADKGAVREAVLDLIDLALQIEVDRQLTPDAAKALDAAVEALAGFRAAVESKRQQAIVAFIVNEIVAPAYRELRRRPEMSTSELEQELQDRARSALGYEFSEEVLEIIAISDLEILSGPLEAACDVVGESLHRTGRTVMKWYTEARFALPSEEKKWGFRRPEHFNKSWGQTASAALFVLNLLKLEAEEERRPSSAEKLAKALELLPRLWSSAAVAPSPSPPPPSPSKPVPIPALATYVEAGSERTLPDFGPVEQREQRDGGRTALPRTSAHLGALLCKARETKRKTTAKTKKTAKKKRRTL